MLVITLLLSYQKFLFSIESLGHFMISAERKKTVAQMKAKASFWWGVKWRQTYWKNLKAFTVPPELENRTLRSSSVTSCLQNMTEKWVCSPTTDTQTDKWRMQLLLTGCLTDAAWQKEGRCSGSSWSRAFWSDAAVSWWSLWWDPGRLNRLSAAERSGAWTSWREWSLKTSSDRLDGSSLRYNHTIEEKWETW